MNTFKGIEIPAGNKGLIGKNKGVMRQYKLRLRDEAEGRDAALPADSPRRRRNKGVTPNG